MEAVAVESFRIMNHEVTPGRVTAASVTLAVAMRVVGQQPLHPNTQVAILVGPKHQMEVIGQRTKANEPQRHAGAPRTQRRDECVAVISIMKHARSLVAAIERMVAIAACR